MEDKQSIQYRQDGRGRLLYGYLSVTLVLLTAVILLSVQMFRMMDQIDELRTLSVSVSIRNHSIFQVSARLMVHVVNI